MPFIHSMLRWTRRLLLTLSVVLCLAFCVLWVRGYFAAEGVSVRAGGVAIGLISDGGRAFVYTVECSASSPWIEYFQPDREWLDWVWGFPASWYGYVYAWSPTALGSAKGIVWPTWVYAAIFAVPPVLWLLWWWKRRPLNRLGFPVIASRLSPANRG